MSYIPGYLEANIRIVDGRLVSQGVAIEPISEDDAGDASSDAAFGDAEFDEKDHPRGDDGKFENGGRKTTSHSATDTPEFKRWFGNSAVIDESGNPLKVYHGSAVSGISEFDTSKSRDIGTHFSESDLSKKFGGNKYEAYLKIENPAEITDVFSVDGADIGTYSKKVPGSIDNALGLLSKDAQELKDLGAKIEKKWVDDRDVDNTQMPEYKKFWKRVGELARQEGFDGFVYQNSFEGGGKSYVVLDKEQVKLV